MPTTGHTVLHLLLTSLLGLCLGGCIQIVDDDDAGSGDGNSTDGTNGGASDGADSTSSSGTTGNAQQRNVRYCEVRVVCEDGSITEAGQSLCLTAEETATELGFIGEACIEDMTAACESIGDGTSLECGGECSEAMEPCECADPTQGCEL